MATSLLRYLRTNAISLLALLVATTTGTAYAATTLSDDSVRSRHVADGAMRQADIATGGVAGLEVADESLTGVDVTDGSLAGADLVDGSVLSADLRDSTVQGTDVGADQLTGADVLESSLGEVPRATIAGHGGYGRLGTTGYDYGDSCDPGSTTYITCTTVSLRTTAAARFLLIGRVDGHTPGGDGGAGFCQLGVSTTGGVPGSRVRVHATEAGNDDPQTLFAVTGSYPAGSYSFGVDCYEYEGNVAMGQVKVLAVAISPY